MMDGRFGAWACELKVHTLRAGQPSIEHHTEVKTGFLTRSFGKTDYLIYLILSKGHADGREVWGKMEL